MAETPRPPRVTIGGSGKLARGLQAAFDAFTAYLDKQAGIIDRDRIQPGVGTNVHRGPGGSVVEAAQGNGGSSVKCPHTFVARKVEDSSNVYALLYNIGRIDPCGAATNTFTGSDIWQSSNIGPTATKWIRAHIMTDGNVATSWEIEESDDPSPPIGAEEGVGPAEFWIDLAVVFNSKVKRIVECANLRVTLQVALVSDKPDPVCAEVNTITHYTWQVDSTAPD